MKQPIWIRERKSSPLPPIPLRPVLWMRTWGERHKRIDNLSDWPTRLLSRIREERESVPVEVILMRYRLLILVFSAWIFKR